MAMAILAGAGAVHAASVDVQVRSANGQPLADAVVFLESREARAALKTTPRAEIAQADKRFVPEVTVVPVGTSVSFPNRDTVRHHVYSFSQPKPFELKLYVGTPGNPVVFDRSGIVVLGCNIHDQMTAWVVVVDTPYYGRTNADGSVRLADVPAGSYRLRSWHPGLPMGAAANDQPLTVGSGNDSAAVTVRLATGS